MKLFKRHIVFLLLLKFCSSQPSFCSSIIQKPEQLRQFDKNFKTRYSGERFNYKGKAVVTNSQEGSGIYDTYQDHIEDPKNNKEDNNKKNLEINLDPLISFFYLCIALAAVYFVYILFKEGGSGLFSSNRHKSINNHSDITVENIKTTDISTLIKNAENNKNYRLAIRYYYLLVLKTLNTNNFIVFEDDKTNAEYLHELKNTPFNKEFEYISYLYNYIWYGEFSINSNEYNKAKQHFSIILERIKS